MNESEPLAAAAVTLSTRKEFLSAARRLITDTRYNASLLTQQLDPRVFGDTHFAETAKQFLLLHAHARFRVLVAQPRLAARGPHALVDLGRVLASRVEFREFAPQQAIPSGEMLLADGRLLLERSGADALESRLVLGDPALARERQRQFDALWDHALPSIELRRLRI